jgi:hypothetical protein
VTLDEFQQLSTKSKLAFLLGERAAKLAGDIVSAGELNLPQYLQLRRAACWWNYQVAHSCWMWWQEEKRDAGRMWWAEFCPRLRQDGYGVDVIGLDDDLDRLWRRVSEQFDGILPPIRLDWPEPEWGDFW